MMFKAKVLVWMDASELPLGRPWKVRKEDFQIFSDLYHIRYYSTSTVLGTVQLYNVYSPHFLPYHTPFYFTNLFLLCSALLFNILSNFAFNNGSLGTLPRSRVSMPRQSNPN